jgi:hypothetical protein
MAADYPYRDLLQKGYLEPLNLPGKTISIDTTDWVKVDIKQVLVLTKDTLGELS